jgi:hypothetical protein
MSILLSRMCVVPTWFVVVGLVALSSPPIVPKGVLLLGAVIAASAVIIAFVLRRGLNGAGASALRTGSSQNVSPTPLPFGHNARAIDSRR